MSTNHTHRWSQKPGNKQRQRIFEREHRFLCMFRGGKKNAVWVWIFFKKEERKRRAVKMEWSLLNNFNERLCLQMGLVLEAALPAPPSHGELFEHQRFLQHFLCCVEWRWPKISATLTAHVCPRPSNEIQPVVLTWELWGEKMHFDSNFSQRPASYFVRKRLEMVEV